MQHYDQKTGEFEAVYLLDDRFDVLVHVFYELEAELDRIKKSEEQIYKNVLEEGNYKEFQRLIAVMYRTSETQNTMFNQIHKICLELLKKANASDNTVDKKKIRELITKIKEVEKQGLAYAEKLPLSIDQGWKPKGEISTFRKLINIPGYLLVAPYLLVSGKKRTMYEKSLNDLKEVVEEARRTVGYRTRDTEEAKQKLGQAMKDFKVFIRLTTQLHRKFKRLRKECMRICRGFEANYTVEDGYISSPINVDQEWAAL